jgi:hypothetical protein
MTRFGGLYHLLIIEYLSQHEYPSVAAAIEFGIFEFMQASPKSKQEILDAVPLGRRGGTALLAVLIACGTQVFHLKNI